MFFVLVGCCVLYSSLVSMVKDRMIHVKTEEMYGKNEIVNSNDMRVHIVNIDTRFRKSKVEPATDCKYEFGRVYKNVIKARVASVEIPRGCYNFSGAKKNTMFRIDASDYTGVIHHMEIKIEDGMYSDSTLIESIQQEMNGIRDMYGIFFRITKDERSNRVTIHHDGSAAPPCPQGPTHCPVQFVLEFGMIGQERRRYDFGLGYNLGYTEQRYLVETGSIRTESVINTEGDSYYLLGIDEMYTVEHNTEETYIQCLAKIIVKGNVVENGYTVLSNEIIFPRPTDLSQVRVRVLDRYGVAIDLHHLNLSISLEITEVMNVELYDSYRNYIWEKAEPRAIKHTSGSSAGIGVPGRNFN